MVGKALAAVLLGSLSLGAFANGTTLDHETKQQKDQRMRWWREARLGMFIHWGLYSIPAGEWNGETDHAEWIRETAHIPVDVYEKFQPQFNPIRFDAMQWVKMAKDAGMKYIVITTKHHDGFCLFDSAYTDWDVMNTPFRRDIMKEMADACRKQGITMCWYHSIMDWHHPDYLPRRSWEGDTRPVGDANMDRYVQYLRNQVTELLTHYGPIGVMWFDGEWESTWGDNYGKPLYDLCRQLQPNVIVNNRVSVSRGGSMEDHGSDDMVGDFATPEQYIPPTGLPGVDWESCMTMNDHWGFNKNDHNWKSSKELIRNIVDIASKGGNYLLNVGPTAEGEFPPEAQDRLKEIGHWMRVNGESIYGTQASLFDTLDWGRCTTVRRNDRSVFYLHVFDWPKLGRLVVPGVGNEPIEAKILDGGEQLDVSRVGSDLVIDLPVRQVDPICTTIRLTVKGEPIIYRTPKISAATTMIVQPVEVTLDSGSKDLEMRYTLDGSEPGATSQLYTKPFSVDRAATLNVAAFHNGKRVSSVATQSFERANLWPANAPEAVKPGLQVQEFLGEWDAVPAFESMKPDKTFDMAGFRLGFNGPAAERVGRMYTGVLTVPEDAVYKFALTSDDGATLLVDGKLVVDNDGLHSTQLKTGAAPLAKGRHSIQVKWFNKTGGAALEVRWAKAGQTMVEIPSSALGSP